MAEHHNALPPRGDADMDLVKLFAMIKQIGVPPGLEENESHFRAWLKHTTHILAEAAEIIDDSKARRVAHMGQMIALDSNLRHDLYTLLLKAREKSIRYYPHPLLSEKQGQQDDSET